MPNESKKIHPRSSVVVPFYRRRSVAIVAVLVIVLLPLLWLAVRNDTYYAGDKQKISSDITTLLNKVQPSRTPVYNAVVDQGCNDKGSVGLATSTVCTVVGYKYYEATGSISSDLHALDALAKGNGWRQAFISESAADQDVLNGVKAGTVTYRPSSSDGRGANPYLSITAYRQHLDDTDIDDLIQSGKIPPLTAGSVIYGVQVTENYWSCTDESLLKLPCPSPPSEPAL